MAKTEYPKKQAPKSKSEQERKLSKELESTFPASDPWRRRNREEESPDQRLRDPSSAIPTLDARITKQTIREKLKL